MECNKDVYMYYPMEFWKEIIKNEEIGKMITKVMNKIYETGKFPVAWKTSLLGRN
jgi:hypothetical protein